MSSSGKYPAARLRKTEPQRSRYKNALTTIRCAVGSIIVALCIWPGFCGEIIAKFNAPALVASTSSVSNHKENLLARTSFQDRWSVVPALVAAPRGKKNEHELQKGDVAKIPFSCELAFSLVVRQGNFISRCVAGIDSSKKAT